MKNFGLPCPKCGSANTWLESDSRVLKAVLRCACGLHNYLSEGALLAAQEDFVAQQRQKLLEAKASSEAEQARVREEERRKEEEREKRRARDRARKERELALVPEIPPCAWQDCQSPKGDNSIYCSRDCSNKNARARHAARKAAEGQRKAG